MADRVFCLMGPTASGKTALACELAGKFPFEIISVDSALIYRGMDIGTAKPGPEELAMFPHHLIDILDPPQSFSAAEFCTAASNLCAAIFSRGKIPLLVGGTMMYFHALQQGLSSLPEADVGIRAQLIEQANVKGWTVLHAELAQIDPISAARIHCHDTQRIQRALEVFYVTGKPMSVVLLEKKTASSYDYVNLALFPEDRAWLHERIAKRFDMMLQQGFIQEVEGLLQTWPSLQTCPSMRSVGYRQACDYLAGKDDYASFRDKGIAATRQLAKRQLTWLRHWPESYLSACDKLESHDEVMANIDKLLDNHPL